MSTGSKSDYLENAFLDAWYGSGSPASIWVALYTVAPTDAGGGTEVSTSDWTNYARIETTNNSTNWPAAVAGVKSNGVAIGFGTAIVINPTTVVAFALFDAVSGHMLHWGELTYSRTVYNGDPVFFPIGGIVIQED